MRAGPNIGATGERPDPSHKILVVDDNEANRLLAAMTLEDEGYAVFTAAGGPEGIETFEREAPACVVLDVRMPDMDGFEVQHQIRALPGGADVPILFLTALHDLDTFDRAQLAGVDDFLTKPIRPARLVSRVQIALKLRELNDERRGLVQQLQDQQTELVRAQLQKERLMAFLVHDLKNPVNSIDLCAQVLLRGRNISEQTRDHSERIREEVRQLNLLLLNLLDVAKADEGSLELKRSPLDVKHLVEQVLKETAVSARHRELELHLSGPSVNARWDVDLMRRAVMNLVENAIRHAPSGSTVHAHIARDQAEVEVYIADSGPGIPAHLRERIFERFIQVDANSGTASRSGRGLGLTFCKLATEAHGGRIWVEDGSPGAVFRVRIPE